MKFPHDSAWFCMEKLKKHSCLTKKQKLTKNTHPALSYSLLVIHVPMHVLAVLQVLTSSQMAEVTPASLNLSNFPDCNLSQGARHLKGTYKEYFLRIFEMFSGPYGPIWARPGPLKSGKSQGKAFLFFQTHLFITNPIFCNRYSVF